MYSLCIKLERAIKIFINKHCGYDAKILDQQDYKFKKTAFCFKIFFWV